MVASSTTKDNLTLFLAKKAITLCKKPVITAPRQDVLTNNPNYQPHIGPSSQEEADTLIILHGLEVVECGLNVDFFTQDTDWWVHCFPDLKLALLLVLVKQGGGYLLTSV